MDDPTWLAVTDEVAQRKATKEVALQIIAARHDLIRRNGGGVRTLPDGTGGTHREHHADNTRWIAADKTTAGELTWADRIDEYTAAALQTPGDDPMMLRDSLVQLGAFVVAWIEDIYRRNPGTTDELADEVGGLLANLGRRARERREENDRG